MVIDNSTCPAAQPDTATILAALQRINSDITTRLDKSDQSSRIAASSPFAQAVLACMQLVTADSVLPQLLITAVQEGDKQGLSPECLLRFVPTWVSLQERSPSKAAHTLSAEAVADLRIAHKSGSVCQHLSAFPEKLQQEPCSRRVRTVPQARSLGTQLPAFPCRPVENLSDSSGMAACPAAICIPDICAPASDGVRILQLQ